MMEGKELLLFQLGPVQEFIAQAETVGDLWAGSTLLSKLTAAALGEIPDYDSEAVFPKVEKGKLEGIPNRFLAYVPLGKGEDLARKCEAAARAELKAIADNVWANKELELDKSERKKLAFDIQVDAFLQTTWAVLKNPTGNIGHDYRAVGKLMAMRRNVRNFDAWKEESNGEVKDFLSGRESALDVKCDRSNKNSARGAMNLIKRFYAKETCRKKVDGKYIAVIMMDGDRMGKKLDSFTDQAQHRNFSKKLADFASRVTIADDDGYLIYAGGDDVLAVVKAERAFTIAKELADKFVKELNDDDKRGVTASVGIAIGSVEAPLQDIIQAARSAEHRAKHKYGRDALSVSILKRSGEILHWGCKFDNTNAFDIYNCLTEKSDKVSRFAYKLAAFLEPYDLSRRDGKGELCVEWKTMKGVMLAETMHVIKRTEAIGGALSEEMVESYLNESIVEKYPEDFLGLFLCETFINRSCD